MFFYLNFIITNSFNFFKKIFINNNYFTYFNYRSNKKNYLYYYISFKKQNSLIKKKFNFLHNLHPIFYRKNFKKKFNTKRSKPLNYNISTIKNYSNLKFLLKKQNKSEFINTLNGKKKLKKFILNNRKLYKFLNFNLTKSSSKLTKLINFNSKLKNFNILLNMEYSIFNVILSSNIVKSYVDLKHLLSLKMVYLNRKNISNLFTILNTGDIIEFSLSKKIFNYIFYFKTIFNKHILKVKNKIWFKLKLIDKNKLNFNNNTLINSIFKNNIILRTTIPNYLEVDYYSLTLIIIFKNFNIKTYNLNIKKILTIYLFKLYNWF